MPPHPLTNFEIQKKLSNEPKFNPKTAGGGGHFDPPLCGFWKNLSSKERVKP